MLPPAAKTALTYLVLATTVVGGLGPTVAAFAGVVPPTYLAALSHAVSVAAALHLWLTESPLVQPLLATKSPAAIISAAQDRALSAAVSK